MLKLLLSVAIMALVTAVLRYLPFFIFGGKKKIPDWVVRLGNKLPYAMMGMIVVYCLRNLTFTSTESYLPTLIAAAVTVLLYCWKKNSLISIAGGTLLYMFLVQGGLQLLS